MDECVRILWHAERRLGREITAQEVEQGALRTLLIPEDYAAVTQVSTFSLAISLSVERLTHLKPVLVTYIQLMGDARQSFWLISAAQAFLPRVVTASPTPIRGLL